MKTKRRNPSCLAGMAVLAVILGGILLVAGYFGWRHYRIATAPVYAFSQALSQTADYMTSSLVSGDVTYVNDVTEFSITVDSNFVTKVIGRTEGEQVLYAVPGQKEPGYAVLTGFMDPWTIFRDSRIPAFDWRTGKIKEIRLVTVDGETREKSTKDAEVIAAVVAALKGELGAAASLDVEIADTIYLVSDDLPGLLYGMRMYVDEAGDVYLAENALSEEWFRAGPRFEGWVKE